MANAHDLLMAQRAAMMGKPLPYDAEVEYLRSSLHEYINTGYVFQYGDEIGISFRPNISPKNTCYFFGSETAYDVGLNSHYDPSVASNGMRCVYGRKTGSALYLYPIIQFSVGSVYECLYNESFLEINGGRTNTGQNYGLNNLPVLLFADYRNDTVRDVASGWCVPEDTFYFWAKRDGVLLRDMVPVVKDGVGYMFDRCGSICEQTGTSLYPNAGSGTFGIGPIKT